MGTRHDQLREKAQEFHNEHPEVWYWFRIYTFQRIDMGFKHYSCRAIFHRIRWETAKPEYKNGEEFKLNNNLSPFYSRRFMKMYPSRAGFFRTRKQTSKGSASVGLPELTPKDYENE